MGFYDEVRMIPQLQPYEIELIDWADEFAQQVLAPNAQQWDEEAHFPPQVFEQLCQRGLAAMLLPSDNGGADLSYVASVQISERLVRGDLGVPFALLLQNNTLRSIWLHGTSDQKERWIPRLADGSLIGAYVITEPDAGSDAGSMKSTAVSLAGDQWKLTGKKWLLSNSPVADVFVTSVVTQLENGEAGGISTFVLERDMTGLHVGQASKTLGARSLPVGDLHFEDLTVDDGHRLGEIGSGMRMALDAVNFARVVWGGIAVGIAEAALEEIIEFLKERQQFGRAIADFQAVQFQLADLACKIEAVRSLTYRAAAAIDLGSRYIELGAMCKKMAGEMVVEVTSACHELLGGRGYLVPHSLERRMRDARLALVADGTTNIQRLVIARSLVGRR